MHHPGFSGYSQASQVSSAIPRLLRLSLHGLLCLIAGKDLLEGVELWGRV